MIVSIKSLTASIESNVKFVNEAIEHHDCTEEKFVEYMEMMQSKLNKCVVELKRISTNDKLISKYETMVTELFK